MQFGPIAVHKHVLDGTTVDWIAHHARVQNKAAATAHGNASAALDAARRAISLAWGRGGTHALEPFLKSIRRGKPDVDGIVFELRALHRTAGAVMPLRRAYELPLLSIVGCFSEPLANGALARARGVPTRLADFFTDRLHPSVEAGGWLIAQGLISTVQRGLSAAALARESARSDAASTAGSGQPDAPAAEPARLAATPSAAVKLPLPALALPKPLSKIDRRIGLLCFSFDELGYRTALNAKADQWSGAKARSVSAGTAPPSITAATHGWEFIQLENASRTAYKPGIVASAVGALLEMLVDLSEADEPSIALQYLRSWSGHGAARVSCHGGCACETRVLESFQPGTTSVDGISRFDVHRLPKATGGDAAGGTRDEPCALRVVVLNQTLTGAHRFKITRLIVETALQRRRRRARCRSLASLARSMEFDDRWMS
jgi:hypothetical protein